MAFPTIPTSGAGRIVTGVQANATSPRTFPSLTGLTKNSGDLLIALIGAYQSSNASGMFSSWGGGFTQFSNPTGGTTVSGIGAAWKISDGTETGTFTVAQTATITGHAAFILLSIPGSDPATNPRANTLATATGSSADPASFDPGVWSNEETLWISVALLGETATAGSFTGFSAPPTNYTPASPLEGTAFSGDVVGGVQMVVAFRQNQVTAEDVGTWSEDNSNTRNAHLVIAVRPAPLIPYMSMHPQSPKQFPDRSVRERRVW